MAKETAMKGSTTRRDVLAALGASLASIALPVTAQQAEYPSRPIKFVAIAAPGTIADLVMRTLANKLNERSGWTVVVENKVSTDWIIPAVYVAQSAPDGYTVLEGLSGMSVLPSTHKNLPYDLLKDLIPVTRLAVADTVLVAHPSVPAKNLRELITYSKAHPGTLTYGSTGVSNPLALIMEQFKLEGGLDATMIPYKTSSAFMPDVLSGRISMALTSVGNVTDHIQRGSLHPIVVTQPYRNAMLPDVQSTTDAGFPTADAGFWFSLMVPAKTPQGIVDKLHTEVVAALQTPEVQEKFTKAGMAVVYDDNPADLRKRIENEIANWARIIRDAKLKFE
jgi:tripartite-type tricarboxylate transporter receptor subunit TctC